jgi:hypothetical protein
MLGLQAIRRRLQLSQELFQDAHSLVYVLFLKQEWREEAQNCVLRAVKKYAFG